jgi:ElaB/YqjD/DUF883 family membrane-anchored ribosome-binding protein
MAMGTELLTKPATVDDVLREVSRMRTVISDAVDDGVRSAIRAVDQGRDAAEDAIKDVKKAIHKNPLQSLGIVFAVGVVAGGLIAWMSSRR